MRHWQKTRAFGAAIVAAVATACWLPAPPASAASCAGTSCDGADPYNSGCATGAELVSSAPLVDGSDRQVGTISLMFSRACQTNWGQAAFDDGNPSYTPPVTVSVTGTNGATTYGDGPVDYTYTGSGSPVWGNMVYSPGCAWAGASRGSVHGQVVQPGCPTPGQPPPPPPASHSHSCSGAACNGLDPYTSGCGSDATSAGSAAIVEAGRQVGALSLLYSRTCQTNWGEASFDDGNPASTPPVDVTVFGTAGSAARYSQPEDFAFSGSGSPVWGNMVYSPGCAYATVARGGASAQAVQTGCPAPQAQSPPSGGCPDTPGAGDSVTRWRPVVTCVLTLLGQPTTPDYVNDVFIVITYESSGNPRAINDSDINAAHGDPSRGLMQTIGSTFEANRSPALPDDIYDPAANIYAGLHYGIHRYGSIPQIPGVRSVNGGGGYVPYKLRAARVHSKRQALGCRTVRAGRVALAVATRQLRCAAGRSFARRAQRSRALSRRLARLAADSLSRPFTFAGFRCRARRFAPLEVARLDLTTYWVGCVRGAAHVTWTARPAGAGKSTQTRVVKRSSHAR